LLHLSTDEEDFDDGRRKRGYCTVDVVARGG
jgi:hypothetical protein